MNFFQEFILGITLAISIGPLFLAAFQIVVNSGFFAGLKFFIGSWITDAIFITLAVFGFEQIIKLPMFNLFLGIFGTCLLFYFSYCSFKKNNVDKEIKKEIKNKNFILQGFILHASNPLAIIFWFGIFGTLNINESIGFINALFIMFGISFAQLLLLVLFSFFNKFKNQEIILKWVNLISGILFFILGLKSLIGLFKS